MNETRAIPARPVAALSLLLLVATGCVESAEFAPGAGQDAATAAEAGGGSACAAVQDGELAYESSTGRCYVFIEGYFSWGSAEALCLARHGAHLVAVDDEVEQLELTKAMEAAVAADGFDPHQVWIGLRSEDGVTWSWSDPDAAADPWLGAWHTNQPNDPAPVCVYAYRTSAWRWHDGSCGAEEMSALCEL